MNRLLEKRQNKQRRAHRVRVMVKSAGHLRLSLNISSKHISAQIIDDTKGVTVVAVSTVGKKQVGNLTEQATSVGQEIAMKAKAKKIKKVAFDRGSKLYHGRVSAFAESARKGGLEF